MSLQALVEGYLATADPSARLRVIEVDQKKFELFDNALAHMILPPPEHPEPSIWSDLASDAQLAFSLAEVYRRAFGSSKIHMEHFVPALYQVR